MHAEIPTLVVSQQVLAEHRLHKLGRSAHQPNKGVKYGPVSAFQPYHARAVSSSSWAILFWDESSSSQEESLEIR